MTSSLARINRLCLKSCSKYGRRRCPENHSREAARLKGDNTAAAMKSVVTDPHAYDWQNDDKRIRSDPKRASGQQGSKL
jgi:pullulanase/glycogen debranching enzyme